MYAVVLRTKIVLVDLAYAKHSLRLDQVIGYHQQLQRYLEGLIWPPPALVLVIDWLQ